MNLESQVLSLELSKKLKELGVEQESLFSWYTNHDLKVNFIEYKELLTDNIYRDWPEPIEIASSFTASELLELLPNMINGNTLKIIKQLDNKLCISYPDIFLKIKEKFFIDENLSNSCAQMLIHLIENNLLETK